MDQINSEILRHFEQQRICINEGIAVDTQLVKSAIRLLSQDELKKQNEYRQTDEGQRDKNCKPLKFCRDLESDWTVRIDTRHFCIKEHTAVDIRHDLVLATTLTPDSVNDTTFLPYYTAYSRQCRQGLRR